MTPNSRQRKKISFPHSHHTPPRLHLTHLYLFCIRLVVCCLSLLSILCCEMSPQQLIATLYVWCLMFVWWLNVCVYWKRHGHNWRQRCNALLSFSCSYLTISLESEQNNWIECLHLRIETSVRPDRATRLSLGSIGCVCMREDGERMNFVVSKWENFIRDALCAIHAINKLFIFSNSLFSSAHMARQLIECSGFVIGILSGAHKSGEHFNWPISFSVTSHWERD